MATTQADAKEKLAKAKVQAKGTTSSSADELAAKLSNLKVSFSAPDISYDENDDGLSVHITTERLRMESCINNPVTVKNYQSVLCDPLTMEKKAFGAQDPETVVEAVAHFDALWKQKNPFNSLTVYHQEQDEFMGQIALYEDGGASQAGIYYCFKPKFWNASHKKKADASEVESKEKHEFKGIGTEAVSAIVEHYAPLLVEKGKTVTKFTPKCEDPQSIDDFIQEQTPFTTLHTTVRQDNIGSYKILEKVGMKRVGEAVLYGGPRYIYEKTIKPNKPKPK